MRPISLSFSLCSRSPSKRRATRTRERERARNLHLLSHRRCQHIRRSQTFASLNTAARLSGSVPVSCARLSLRLRRFYHREGKLSDLAARMMYLAGGETSESKRTRRRRSIKKERECKSSELLSSKLVGGATWSVGLCRNWRARNDSMERASNCRKLRQNPKIKPQLELIIRWAEASKFGHPSWPSTLCSVAWNQRSRVAPNCSNCFSMDQLTTATTTTTTLTTDWIKTFHNLKARAIKIRPPIWPARRQRRRNNWINSTVTYMCVYI